MKACVNTGDNKRRFFGDQCFLATKVKKYETDSKN